MPSWKFEFEATCPHCEKTMYHHGVDMGHQRIAIVTCWEDNGGCGKAYKLRAKITCFEHIDENGWSTGEEVEVL